MGVVRLPSVSAYWSASKVMPDHFFTKDLTLWRYTMLWRCLHITPPTLETSQTDGDDDPGDPQFCDDNDDDLSNDDDGVTQEEDNRWFKKVGPLFDHVRDVIKTLFIPGSRLGLDEMMVRFYGRSAETFRIKTKPIGEGYKVIALACATTGYVYSMTPDGRLGSGEVDTTQGGGKIAAMVTHLTNQLPPPHGFKYTLAMDNYFTTPATMKALRDNDIGAFGTARARKHWPPKELKAVDSLAFNDCHYTVDDVGSRVYRWVDNSVVTFVTTIHDQEVAVTANRKKPRMTQTNKHNLQMVWGDNHVATIDIPEFIDDYNHQMNAVDRADQLIASLTMKHKCRRTWVPFMLYLLNIIRINSYIVHRELHGKMTHMEFTLGLVQALHSRRNDVRVTRKRAAEDASPTNAKAPISKRMRNSVEPLPDSRLRHPESHKATFYAWRRKCFFCRYQAAKLRNSGKTHKKINICSRGCPACGDLALCKSCFDLYHSKESQ